MILKRRAARPLCLVSMLLAAALMFITCQDGSNTGYTGEGVVGSASSSAVEDDGITWTMRAGGTTKWLRDVHYANNTWVAVGSQRCRPNQFKRVNMDRADKRDNPHAA